MAKLKRGHPQRRRQMQMVRLNAVEVPLEIGDCPREALCQLSSVANLSHVHRAAVRRA